MSGTGGGRLGALHPRRFAAALAGIDARAAGLRRPGDRRPAVALVTAAVCLLLIHYLKFATSYRAFLGDLMALGGAPARLVRELVNGPWYHLAGQAWWGWWHLVGYVLIPALVIRLVFRERIRDHGLHATGLRSHGAWYALLAAPILVFAVAASHRPDFIAQYPFYHLAARSWADLLAWEAIYLGQFVCLEFFFRGFLLHTMLPAMGANAVFAMALPYALIHTVKPWPEAAGAVLFGIFLGVLALRSGAIWGGVLVHCAVALTMDLAAIVQGPGLPAVLWPAGHG